MTTSLRNQLADDTTVVDLIANGDKSDSRMEVEQLVALFSTNHLLLNTQKTVEMVVDFRHNAPPNLTLPQWFSVVSTVQSFKFLSTTI